MNGSLEVMRVFLGKVFNKHHVFILSSIRLVIKMYLILIIFKMKSLGISQLRFLSDIAIPTLLVHLRYTLVLQIVSNVN